MEHQHTKAGDARRVIAILLGLALAVGVALLVNYNYQKRDEPVDLTTASTAQKTNWLQGDYVNEFGDKTGERYTTNRVLFRGTYSNSAVDGNPLYVRIRADADQNFALQFFENYPSYDYRKRQYSDLKYDVIIQDSTGKPTPYGTFEGVASGASLRIVDKSYRGDLLASLMNNEKALKFFIRGQKRKIETYRFDISSGQIAGFTNALHNIIPPAISSDEMEDRETFNEKAFPHAISPASPAGVWSFNETVKRTSKAIKCESPKISPAVFDDGRLYGCVKGKASTAKYFINEAAAGGAVENIKVMWNDWYQDVGYGVHADRSEALSFVRAFALLYAIDLEDDLVATFVSNEDASWNLPNVQISYTYKRGPKIDERLLVLKPL